MIGIKEGTYCDKHQVIYGSIESLYSIPETSITLLLLEFKQKPEKKEKKIVSSLLKGFNDITPIAHHSLF